MPRKREEKTVTINLDVSEAVYSAFRDYCEQNGLIITRKVESLMKEYLENEGVLTPGA